VTQGKLRRGGYRLFDDGDLLVSPKQGVANQGMLREISA
jgi:hypothetical protein